MDRIEAIETDFCCCILRVSSSLEGLYNNIRKQRVTKAKCGTKLSLHFLLVASSFLYCTLFSSIGLCSRLFRCLEQSGRDSYCPKRIGLDPF